MARSFELSAESSASTEQLLSAFSDEEYWLARLAAFDGITSLDSLIVDTDGRVTVSTTQNLRPHRLPGMVAQLLPGDLNLLRKETWSPIEGRRVQGEVKFTPPGRLGSGTATALLTPTPNGSRLTFNVAVKVRAPLIAGRIESYLGGELAEQIPAVQRFTTAWIAEHTCR
jgi:hypothetical protein